MDRQIVNKIEAQSKDFKANFRRNEKEFYAYLILNTLKGVKYKYKFFYKRNRIYCGCFEIYCVLRVDYALVTTLIDNYYIKKFLFEQHNLMYRFYSYNHELRYSCNEQLANIGEFWYNLYNEFLTTNTQKK